MESPKIARTFRLYESDYECKFDWPEDCFVQAGSSGIVFSPHGNYKTAFFEAFPKNPDSFIRGEGKDIIEAEEKAWKKLNKTLSCSLDHKNKDSFIRKNYRNGAGFCKECNLFLSKVFDPLEICCICGCNTYYYSDRNGNWYCKNCSSNNLDKIKY